MPETGTKPILDSKKIKLIIKLKNFEVIGFSKSARKLFATSQVSSKSIYLTNLIHSKKIIKEFEKLRKYSKLNQINIESIKINNPKVEKIFSIKAEVFNSGKEKLIECTLTESKSKLKSKKNTSVKDPAEIEEIQKANKKLKAIFENNPLMIFILDEKGIIKEVNNCGAKELGYEVNELNNKPVIKVFLEEDWDTVLKVNLGGYFKFAKYCIPEILKSGGGTIINISSVASALSIKNFGVYSVSKAAINALTRSLAVDFAPSIRVNSICPGFVRIENSENNRSPEDLKKWYAETAKQYPLGRVAEVKEIASVASFLASDESSYINGQSIVVDGGKTISDSHDF